MRTIIALILVMVTSHLVLAQVSVKGYYKKNGTYVAPYIRSSPNSTKTDNYSYPGNVNPYTGKVAPGGAVQYVNPYDETYATPPITSIKPLTPYPVPSESERNYKTDKYGNKTMYTVFNYRTAVATGYKIYDMNNAIIGYLTMFDNGDYTLYDMGLNVIKKVIAPPKPVYKPSPLLKQF